MTQNLLAHHLDPAGLPMVLQYNKRDLPQVSEIDALDRTLNARRTKAVPAVAREGQGVLETFTAILERTVQDLASRYAILDVRGAAPLSAWVEETVRQLFGTRELVAIDLAGPDPADTVAIPPTPSRPASPSTAAAVVVPAERPPAPTTVVRVAPPAAQLEPSSPSDSRITRAEQLVETYAEASAQVGVALSEVREERDTLRSQLEELRRSYQCAEKVLDGTPLEVAIAPLLDSMAALAGVEQAAFWRTQADTLPRAVALRGLDADPLLAEPPAARKVSAVAASASAPAVHEGDPLAPSPRRSPRTAASRRAADPVPDAGRPSGRGGILLRGRHGPAGRKGPRAAERDPAGAVRSPGAGGDAADRARGRAGARARAHRHRLAARSRARRRLARAAA